MYRGAAQQLRNCSMVERITRGRGDFSVGRNLPPGDRANDAAKRGIARLIFAKRIFQDPSLEILWSNRPSHEQNFIRGCSERTLLLVQSEFCLGEIEQHHIRMLLLSFEDNFTTVWGDVEVANVEVGRKVG